MRHNNNHDRKFIADLLDVSVPEREIFVNGVTENVDAHLFTARKSPDLVDGSLFYYEDGVKRRKDVLVIVLEVSDVPATLAYDNNREAAILAAVDEFRLDSQREFSG